MDDLRRVTESTISRTSEFADRPAHTCVLTRLSQNILLLDQLMFMNSDSCTTISRRAEVFGMPSPPPPPGGFSPSRSCSTSHTQTPTNKLRDNPRGGRKTCLRGSANANTLRSPRTSQRPWTIGNSSFVSFAEKNFRLLGV